MRNFCTNVARIALHGLLMLAFLAWAAINLLRDEDPPDEGIT